MLDDFIRQKGFKDGQEDHMDPTFSHDGEYLYYYSLGQEDNLSHRRDEMFELVAAE